MQERSTRTRAEIIDAAQRLFGHNSYENTSVAEICQQANVSKGAFYHHFPTKHDLFLELLDQWLDGIDMGLQVSRQQVDNVPHALLSMARSTEAVFEMADGRLPMFLEFWSQARLDPAVWEATIAPYRRYQDFFAELLEEGIEQGDVRPIEPQVGARMLVALAVGLLLQSVLEPTEEHWAEVVEKSVDILLQGLIRRSA